MGNFPIRRMILGTDAKCRGTYRSFHEAATMSFADNGHGSPSGAIQGVPLLDLGASMRA